jgi:hypothetical protein
MQPGGCSTTDGDNLGAIGQAMEFGKIVALGNVATA